MNLTAIFKLLTKKKKKQKKTGTKRRFCKTGIQQVDYQKLPKDTAHWDQGGGKHRQNLSNKKLQVMSYHLHKASGEKRGNQKRTQTGNKVEQLLKSSTADRYS